jgi:hypothetical protein
VAGILSLGAFVVGCTPQQVAVVAQQAGVASIVTWISVDNPTDAQKAVASEIVTTVKSNASLVAAGASYYATLSPVIDGYIEKSVPENSRPLARLASGWVLTGIDTFFAMYPKYAEDATQALAVVNAFCDGAKVGLSMAKDDPVIKAATRGSTERAKVRKSIQ